MRWKVKPRWGAMLIPAAGGAVVSALVSNLDTVDNPIFYARADLATVALLTGLGLSIAVALGLTVWELDKQRRQYAVDVRAQAADERRRFLQRLDHEFKNPLTAIRVGLANAVNSPSIPAQQEVLASVEAQVMRLSRLTADLRKLSELETRPLEQAPVNIAELLQEAVMLAQEQPGAETRKVILNMPQAPWPVPDILGDWDLLFLATYNLLDNALKFTRSGDTIEIRASEASTFVTIQVADTGPGIPSEELPRVWEELYRGQGARGIPGSGLGLALVRAIAELHGGSVTLRSRVGQGTVVTMRLPVG